MSSSIAGQGVVSMAGVEVGRTPLPDLDVDTGVREISAMA
jgi:hypothetical protein